MRILVTGASGLLGRRVVALLRSKGHSVAAVSRTRALDSEALLVDLAEVTQIEKLPKNLDCVVHLAALLPAPAVKVARDAWFQNNTQSTLNLLEFCAQNEIVNFIYGSTWSVYGNPAVEGPVTEGTEARPGDLYSLSKLSGEILTHPYAFCYGIKVKILRFSYIYGDGMREDTVVERFIDLAMNSGNIKLINEGRDRTDLLYVDDAAEAVAAALSARGGTYNVGSGIPITIIQLAETAIAVTDSKSRFEFLAANQEAKRFFLSIEKAKRELGWAPRHTLSSGLRRLVDARRHRVFQKG